MNGMAEQNPWVWVAIQDPGGNEQILGQHDRESNIDFIPAFLEKDDASQALPHLIQETGKTYEIQTIRFNELARQARENGFVLFILNAAGHILEKINP